MLYQAFFYLLSELAKNEDGPEFAFLDSLNLYKKEGREVHSCVFYIMAASLVSLNKAPVLSLSTVGSQILTLSRSKVSYSSSWLLFQLYGESVNVSYIEDLCRLVVLCQKLPKSLLCHARCSRIKPLLAIL